MTHSQLTALLAHLDTDAALMATFRACTNASQCAALAQQVGYTVSEEDIEVYLDDHEVELTAEQLASVAGGFRDSYSFPPLFQSFR